MNSKLVILGVILLTILAIPFQAYAESEYDESDEREYEDESEESTFGVNSSLILYVTIGAIVAAVGYTGYKVLAPKKVSLKK